MADEENLEEEEQEKSVIKYFSCNNINYLLTQLAERIKEAHINE